MNKSSLTFFPVTFFIILLTIFAACKKDNIENVYYAQSTKRFDYDYSEKVNDTKEFLKIFGDAYRKTINDSFPDFTAWDSLPFLDPLNAKATLYISNYRGTLLRFDATANPELYVEATDVPIQDAITYGIDLFPPSRGPSNVKEMLQYMIILLPL